MLYNEFFKLNFWISFSFCNCQKLICPLAELAIQQTKQLLSDQVNNNQAVRKEYIPKVF